MGKVDDVWIHRKGKTERPINTWNNVHFHEQWEKCSWTNMAKSRNYPRIREALQ